MRPRQIIDGMAALCGFIVLPIFLSHQATFTHVRLTTLVYCTLFAIQSFRLFLTPGKSAKVKAVNIINDVILPSADDPRWELSHGTVTRKVLSDAGWKVDTYYQTIIYTLNNISVHFRPGAGFIDEYIVTIEGSSQTFKGFPVRRYWRAIRYDHTQRHALKAIDA